MQGHRPGLSAAVGGRNRDPAESHCTIVVTLHVRKYNLARFSTLRQVLHAKPLDRRNWPDRRLRDWRRQPVYSGIIMRIRAQIVPILAGVFLSLQAHGSISMAGIATRYAAGGLEFRHDTDIVLVREDLFISPSEVRVQYVFRSTSKKRQTQTLAFRLPWIAADFASSYYAPSDMGGASGDIRNYLDFGVAVNGQPIIPVLHGYATVDDTDISAELRAAGLPLMSSYDAYVKWRERTRKHNPETIKSLVASGALRDFGSYVDRSWHYQTVFDWQQVLPAGETVTVSIHYRPILIDARDYGAYEFHRGQRAEAVCVDDALRQKIDEVMGTGRYYGVFQLVYLNTGAQHGSAPVREFNLTVGPADPDVSNLTYSAVCPATTIMDGDGTRHWSARNYVPKHDFRVTFYVFPPAD